MEHIQQKNQEEYRGMCNVDYEMERMQSPTCPYWIYDEFRLTIPLLLHKLEVRVRSMTTTPWKMVMTTKKKEYEDYDSDNGNDDDENDDESEHSNKRSGNTSCRFVYGHFDTGISIMKKTPPPPPHPQQ